MSIVIEGLDGLRGHVGQELGVSRWLDVDQRTIDLFAEATGDHHWIHTAGPEAAAGPYGVAISHGYLNLSLIGGLIQEIFEVRGANALNYGIDRVRFPNVVRAGARVRLRVGLDEAEEVGPAVRAHFHCVIELQDEIKPACVADIAFQYYPYISKAVGDEHDSVPRQQETARNE